MRCAQMSDKTQQRKGRAARGLSYPTDMGRKAVMPNYLLRVRLVRLIEYVRSMLTGGGS